MWRHQVVSAIYDVPITPHVMGSLWLTMLFTEITENECIQRGQLIIWPILRNNWKTVWNRCKFVLSTNMKSHWTFDWYQIGDLECPWTAWPIISRVIWKIEFTCGPIQELYTGNKCTTTEAYKKTPSHVTSFCNLLSTAEGSAWKYSWVSSAYECTSNPCHRVIATTSAW